MHSLSEKINSKQLYKAFELMHQKKLEEAEKILEKGIAEAQALQDSLLEGLYDSAYGVLYKLKKDFKKAWKFYEKAERLIPNDPALKIISSRLLLDYFGQYDTVIRKLDKVIEMVGDNIPFLYEAHTLQGVAYLRKGNRKKAAELLKKSMENGFEGLQSSVNLDFKLLEEMMRKKIEPALCKFYLEAAHAFTKKTGEKRLEQVIQKLLKLLAASA